jgi:hypothetical protein
MRTLLLLAATTVTWSSASRGRWDMPAFDWWRRSVRRSLTVLGVVTVLALAVATVGR